jgi:hypothetical protein
VECGRSCTAGPALGARDHQIRWAKILILGVCQPCEMHSESLAGNSNNSPLTTPIRTTNLSRRFSSSNQLSGLLATSRSKDSGLNADYNVDTDHARITMKTRVAVRDKTPHRFQVVPLRDVSGLTLLDGGRPSQLTLPPASHTLLRSASIRRQTHSQVRPVIASSYSELDIIQNKCDMMMLADSETLATPSAGIPILTLSPSSELDNSARSHALAEQDMNRQDTTATTNKYESSVTTPTRALQSYDASHHAHVPVQCSVMDSKSPRKKRTRSENIPRVRDNNRRDGLAVNKDKSDFRMSKRHAIYTQALYVPFLEPPSYFPGSPTEDRKGHPSQLFNENVSDSHLSDEIFFSKMPQAFVTESGTTLSNGRISPTIGLVPPSETPLQVLMLKFPGSATRNERYRGLNYHRLSRVYPLSVEARLHIVYPQIVREMFADIDRAIKEWKQI